MTPQELKNSILQLAIQGKLVEQRPEEGNGEEIYLKIKEEKQKLIQEGKVKCEKPLPEISEEEKAYDIPENWKWARLDDLVVKEIKRGKSPTYTASSNVLVFAQKCNTKAGHIDLSLALCLDEGKFRQYPESELMRDMDIAINSTGNGTLGRVGFYRDKDNPNCKPVVPDSHVTVIRVNNSLCTKYIYYGLKYYQPYLEKLGSGSTNQTELSANTIKMLVFPLPPLAEQRRIVDKIEELLPLIDRYEKAWSRLEEFNKRFPDDLKKSLLQMAIQGKLVEQWPEEGTGEELYQQIQAEKQDLYIKGEVYRDKGIKPITKDGIPFDIPESWFWCRLGEITRLITKGSSPAWQGVSYTDETNGVLFVTSENVGDNTMLLNKRKYVETKFNIMHPASILKKNDILTNLVGASIGRSALFEEECDNANINQAVCIIRLVNYCVSDYVRIMLRSESAIRMMLHDTVDTARANLSLVSVSNLLIPLPPLAEQKRIVACLEELLPLCNSLQNIR